MWSKHIPRPLRVSSFCDTGYGRSNFGSSLHFTVRCSLRSLLHVHVSGTSLFEVPLAGTSLIVLTVPFSLVFLPTPLLPRMVCVSVSFFRLKWIVLEPTHSPCSLSIFLSNPVTLTETYGQSRTWCLLQTCIGCPSLTPTTQNQ